MVKDLVKNLCVFLETDIGGVSGATSRKVVVATPVITLTDNSVTITCATTGATIYYTLDGSTPTSSSSQYSSAFTLDSSCTIKAIAIKGGKSSGIAEEEYVKPITYLTQWKIVGNSEMHGQEIWSCGEYNATDGKYHILVQPLGGSIADIALTEPLRKVNDVADTIEFPSDTEGKVLVTRPLGSETLRANNFSMAASKRFLTYTLRDNKQEEAAVVTNTLIAGLTTYSYIYLYAHYTEEGIYGSCKNAGNHLCVTDPSFIEDGKMTQAFRDFIEGKEIIYELATPTTELVDAPQIAEAESYTCVISQGGKAVEWSSFETE